MQSPMPPGRMARRRLFDNDRELDFQRLGRQARPFVASLIFDLARDRGLAGLGVRRYLEIGHDVEHAGVDRERLFREWIFLHRRLWILDFGHLQNPARSPRQSQWDQVLVGRRVAVAVVAFTHAGLDFGRDRAAALAHDRHGRSQRHSDGLAEPDGANSQQ